VKCYKHNNLDAVSTCNSCGKGLCSECTNYFSKPICLDCNAELVAGDKKVFTRNIVLTIIFFVVGFLYSNEFPFYQQIFYGYVLAGLPWGWSFLNRITPNVFLILPLVGWVIYFAIKFVISLFIGPFITPYKIYQSIKGLKDSKELEVDIQNLKAS